MSGTASLPLLLKAERLAGEASLLPDARRRLNRTERVWRYRSYEGGEPIGMIDWRQSARGDRLLVREAEPLRQLPVFLFPGATEGDRAALLLAALGFMLVKVERKVGWLSPSPRACRAAGAFRELTSLALAAPKESLPPDAPGLPPASIVLANDVPSLPPAWRERVQGFAARGHSILILDFSEASAPLPWPRVPAAGRDEAETLLALFAKTIEETMEGSALLPRAFL